MKRYISRIFATILSFSVLLFVFGCSTNTETEPEDKNITTISKVLEHSFTGPDQELIEIWEDIESTANEMAESFESTIVSLNDHSNEKFQPYFTGDGYTQYISVFGFTFLRNAYWNNYQLAINNIEIKTSEVKDNIYNFTAEVEYQKEGKDKQNIKISGEANVNEDGLITNMLIRDKGLWKALKE